MRAIARRLETVRSVCAGHGREHCKIGSTNRHAVVESGTDSRALRNHALWVVGTYGSHLANTIKRSVLGGDADCHYSYCGNLFFYEFCIWHFKMVFLVYRHTIIHQSINHLFAQDKYEW